MRERERADDELEQRGERAEQVERDDPDGEAARGAACVVGPELREPFGDAVPGFEGRSAGAMGEGNAATHEMYSLMYDTQ